MGVSTNEEMEMFEISGQDVQPKNKPKGNKKVLLVVVLVIGLILFNANYGLHILVASRYFAMRNCHRSFQQTFVDFKLSSYVDLNSISDLIGTQEKPKPPPSPSDRSLPTDTTEEEKPAPKPKPKPVPEGPIIQELINSKVGPAVESLIDDTLYVKLRENIIKIMPRHWVQRIVDIVSFQVSRHDPATVPDLCTINGRKFSQLTDMALYICSGTFEDGDIDSEEGTAVKSAVKSIISSRDLEQKLLNLALKGDFDGIIEIVLDGVDVKELMKVIERIQETFDDPNDIKSLLGLLQFPEISGNIGKLASVLGTIDPKHLQGSADALGKIKPENMVKLEALLGDLNITLATLILDPGIFVQFLGQPDKAQVLIQLQTLLPAFTPKDLNHILTVKLTFDEQIENSDVIIGRLLSLPFSLLSKVFTLNIAPEELEVLESVADKFLSSPDMKSLITFATSKWDLLSAQGRSNFANNCSMPRLDVNCVDKTLDLCPNGHQAYGLATICVVILPGLLFAISAFVRHKAFVLLDLDKTHGEDFNLAIRLLLLPFYAAVMVVLIIPLNVLT